MKNKAFTLAEVLITLSIIGVVAALTIPSLVIKNQEKERIVQLKKAYNMLNNSFRLASIEEDPSSWGWEGVDSQNGALKVLNILAKNLNLIKNCGNDSGCFNPNVNYKTLSGNNVGVFDPSAISANAILADGMFLKIGSHSSNCERVWGNSPALKQVCGYATIDVNGAKSPNTIGKDLFSFWITQDSIIPFGTEEDTRWPLSGCRNTYGCTAWALLKENLDYPPAGTGWDGTVVTP